MRFSKDRYHSLKQKFQILFIIVDEIRELGHPSYFADGELFEKFHGSIVKRPWFHTSRRYTLEPYETLAQHVKDFLFIFQR